MKFLIILVFCGSLALEANGVRVRVFRQDSEKDGLKEVTDASARRVIQVKKRFEKLDPKEDPRARWGAAEKEKDYEYEQSIVKILNALLKIVTKGVPLLYPRTVECGKGVGLKCQYTSNKTEDEGFFGYQVEVKPQMIMMRVMNSIDKLVSHPILRTYVEMLDYSAPDSAPAVENDGKPRARSGEFDLKKIKLSKLLMFVKRIVHWDPEDVPQNFVCGIQMDKEKSNCKYYKEGTPADSKVGFRFDATGVNDAVKTVFTSRDIMKWFIKVANDAAGIFPSLKPGRKVPGSDDVRFKNTAELSTAQDSS